MKIGVLALQGDFAEHIAALERLNIAAKEVKLPQDLTNLAGLIIPGGESTTISRLLHEWKLHTAIHKQVKKGMGIWGTCAGAILLAQKVEPKLDPPGLALMDIEVKRNAFGRQVDSFDVELNCPAISKQPFSAVFIRAPIITKVGAKTKILIQLDDGTIVAAQQKRLLATAFHPELTNDDRLLRYFLKLLSK